MIISRRHTLVLSIYSNARGFAFLLLEGPLSPADWAIVELRGSKKNERCLRRIRRLMERYTPDVLVLRKPRVGAAKRIHILNEAIAGLAGHLGIPLRAYSRDDMNRTFGYLGLVTKQTIAETLAKHIPALERYLPPPRKIWKSEDARMGLFDAGALAFTFFQSSRSPETLTG